jgi:hypothetical protein
VSVCVLVCVCVCVFNAHSLSSFCLPLFVLLSSIFKEHCALPLSQTSKEREREKKKDGQNEV